ncbi:DNA topoisomerase [Candidatus Magnetaquicoccus inordinatus]|uniref:DNA topoisomerase n=1 Tax=Candidatus Magnetaquicoccus inordinatus TaxID=2496818 RepID=UPI00102AE68D|nr:DNA topoisomerase [Candidatus Magnetaquicoccus inordinatus]
MAEKRTQPPNRFTDGTLIQAMKQVGRGVENPRLKQILRETAGIGTEATRAAIIENLLKRELLAKEGKKNLVSTETGRMLVDLLPHSVTDPATTAVWEQALDDIAQGQGSLAEFQAKVELWVTRLTEQVKRRSPLERSIGLSSPAVVAEGSASPACPQCGRPMRQRRSAQGEFWGCSGYPACRGTLPGTAGAAISDPTGVGAPCPLCKKGQLVTRTAHRGKNKDQPFLGCNQYPACRFSRSTER